MRDRGDIMHFANAQLSPSPFIANRHDAVFNLDVRSFSDEDLYQKLTRSIDQLNQGEVLRVLCDHNPVLQIGGLVKRHGSKIIFQYLKNHRGHVVIDFKKTLVDFVARRK